jgi:hypothetical protein
MENTLWCGVCEFVCGPLRSELRLGFHGLVSRICCGGSCRITLVNKSLLVFLVCHAYNNLNSQLKPFGSYSCLLSRCILDRTQDRDGKQVVVKLMRNEPTNRQSCDRLVILHKILVYDDSASLIAITTLQTVMYLIMPHRIYSDVER